MTEDELENLQPPGESVGVAIVNKHAYNTVVVPSHDSKQEPSPSKVISDKPVAVKKQRERINSLEQKELAIEAVRLTRLKIYKKVVDAIEAEKWNPNYVENGCVVGRMEADFERQKWGVEIGLKMLGDLIERKEIEYDVGDKTLEKYKAMSVAEMKGRMAEMLLGKRADVIDVETRPSP